jgi:hypothetical protein
VRKITEQAFKSMLAKAGYKDKPSNEVWKWYTAPSKKLKNRKIPN